MPSFSPHLGHLDRRQPLPSGLQALPSSGSVPLSGPSALLPARGCRQGVPLGVLFRAARNCLELLRTTQNCLHLFKLLRAAHTYSLIQTAQNCSQLLTASQKYSQLFKHLNTAHNCSELLKATHTYSNCSNCSQFLRTAQRALLKIIQTAQSCSELLRTAHTYSNCSELLRTAHSFPRMFIDVHNCSQMPRLRKLLGNAECHWFALT